MTKSAREMAEDEYMASLVSRRNGPSQALLLPFKKARKPGERGRGKAPSTARRNRLEIRFTDSELAILEAAGVGYPGGKTGFARMVILSAAAPFYLRKKKR